MALLLNEYPYSDYQKINLDWVLDLCNKLKADAENGEFDGPRGYSVLGGENVIISQVNLGDVVLDYGVPRTYIPDAQIGDFVIGKYNNILSIMLITGIDASLTVFYGNSVTSLQGPPGPQGEQGEGGLTEAMKQALLQLARKVAYIDGNGQTYYNALYNAFYGGAPVVVLDSITAVFNQGSTVVYDTDTLNSLKPMLTVTAHYSDNTTATVPSTDYILSGTLTVGTSVITVSYSGETTTFNVLVSSPVAPSNMLYNWNFKNSLTDSVGGQTAVLDGATRDGDGLHFTGALHNVLCGTNIMGRNRTIEIKFGTMVSVFDYTSRNGIFFWVNQNPSSHGFGWAANKHAFGGYWKGGWYLIPSVTDLNYFSDSLLKITIDSNGNATYYKDGVQIGGSTDNTYQIQAEDTVLLLGSNNSNYPAFYNMIIEEVHVYEGVV